MQMTGESIDKGVVERGFRWTWAARSVPGILWRPEAATGPTPLVLLGHGGLQHKRALNILGLARRFVRHLGAVDRRARRAGHGDRVVDAARRRGTTT